MQCVLCAMCRDIQKAYCSPVESEEPELHWTCSVALAGIYVVGLEGRPLFLCEDHKQYLRQAMAHPMKPVPLNQERPS